MPTSALSTYLANCYRKLGNYLETKPSIAFALGKRIEIITFANSENHINAIAKEFGTDVEQMDNGDLVTRVTDDGFTIVVYLCRSAEDGK